MENVAIYLLLWWVFCGGIGAAVGQLKEKAIQGMLLGALFKI